MSMTLEEKWLSLFHNVLQLESLVTPEIASDALLLIKELYACWRREQEKDGYEFAPNIVDQTQNVLEALRMKADGAPPSVTWPIDTFMNWEQKRPFHAAADTLLKADWYTFKALAIQTLTQSQDDTPQDSLWIVAESEPLRKAWSRVCTLLLSGSKWQVQSALSIAAITISSVKKRFVLVLGSPWDAQSQAPLIQYYRQRLNLLTDMTVVSTCLVTDVMEIIGGSQQRN